MVTVEEKKIHNCEKIVRKKGRSMVVQLDVVLRRTAFGDTN